MPIRAELAAASARLGPERATETLLGAQKRLETAQNIRETVVQSPHTRHRRWTTAHAMEWGGGWVAVAERCGQ